MNNLSGSSLAADNFVTYSEDALSGQSRTDWEGLDALSEDEIDTSDIPPLTEEEFARMQWRFPARFGAAKPAQAVTVEVAVDENILAWFQAQGQDYPQRMRAALRLYAEAHQSPT